MNEGHSAFLGPGKDPPADAEKKLTFHEAWEAVWATNVFTTHTPVPAGNERFAPSLMEKYFGAMAPELGLSWRDFLGLGREDPNNDGEEFCLTVLALKLSAYNNGVSRLHGRVSRAMWRNIWPSLPLDEVPIYSHHQRRPPSIMDHARHGRSPGSLFRSGVPRHSDKSGHLGPDRQDLRRGAVADARTAQGEDGRICPRKAPGAAHRRGVHNSELSRGANALSPYALTISFARRFATYKRADLLLADPERLIRLLTDNERPLQLIFAGKAHPHDLAGKEIIKKIVHFTSDPRVASRVVFLEDYDMTMSRYLVSGSDIWLNTPRRPLEASGTSGMKAAMNGALNVSILDGWWDEAYSTQIGWAIGRGEEYEDEALQDEVEGKALYDLLEREIIPLFYTRGMDGLPREWIHRMKESMREVGKGFSSAPDADGVHAELLLTRSGPRAGVREGQVRAVPGDRLLPGEARAELG